MSMREAELVPRAYRLIGDVKYIHTSQVVDIYSVLMHDGFPDEEISVIALRKALGLRFFGGVDAPLAGGLKSWLLRLSFQRIEYGTKENPKVSWNFAEESKIPGRTIFAKALVPEREEPSKKIFGIQTKHVPHGHPLRLIFPNKFR